MSEHNEQMAAEEQHFASIEPYQTELAALQAENKRLREWRQLALTFAQRQYRISVSNRECHIPLLDWDLFRDTAQDLVKQEKALEGGE